jgi:predicted Zn-ribbon and HTH transcriptional regulator
MFRRLCPRCLSWYIYKSRFWHLEYLLLLLLLRPVRCRDCERRYYRLIFLPVLQHDDPGQHVPSDFSD